MEIARFVTRPSGDVSKFNETIPNLIIGRFFESGRHLLKSNCIYELIKNQEGKLELIEKGESIIGNKWKYAYFKIQHHLGKKMWLTKDELEEWQSGL